METAKDYKTSIEISVEEIPKLSLRIFFILLTVLFIPYIIIYYSNFVNEIVQLRELINSSFFSFLFRMVWIPVSFLAIALFGIVLHEAIHALFFSFFLPSRFQGVKFGFNKEHGIPFVHILEPITVLGFRIGAIMPLIILGIIPSIMGLYYGSFGLTIFGALFTVSGSGDLLLISKTKGLSLNKKLKDMPDKIGFELL